MVKIRDIIQLLDTPILGGDLEHQITSVTSDSRSVLPGAVFVCIIGKTYDGHDFINEAIDKGAVLIVSERKLHSFDTIGLIQIDSPRDALAKISCALYCNNINKLHLSGITGTNGKTTTSFMVHHIMRSAEKKTGLIGTIKYDLGNRILPAQRTTPEADELCEYLGEMIRCNCDSAVMEVSSHAIDLKRVSEILFDIVVFTNLSHDHLDYHENMEKYFDVKSQLFLQLKKDGIAVINYDCPYGRRLMDKLSVPIIGYGKSHDAQIRAEKIKTTMKGISFYLNSPWGSGVIKMPLLGKFNVDNALAAVAVAGAYGLPFSLIQKSLKNISYVPGRLELVRSFKKRFVFIDYAHTPDALEVVLNSIRLLIKGEIWLVFGCGGNRDKKKRRLMGKIASIHADKIIITSDNPRKEDPITICQDIIQGFDDINIPYIETDRKQAIEYALKNMKRNDALLVAGKGHEIYQEINGMLIPFDDRNVINEWLR